MDSVFNNIIKWNKDRNIPKEFSLDSEVSKLQEELDEFKEATSADLQIDALCDLVVVATGAMWKLGYNPVCSMGETLKEINSRSGVFNVDSGKWEKVLTGGEYEANYGGCTHGED